MRQYRPTLREWQSWLREHTLDAAFYAESGDCHDPRCQRLIAARAATPQAGGGDV